MHDGSSKTCPYHGVAARLRVCKEGATTCMTCAVDILGCALKVNQQIHHLTEAREAHSRGFKKNSGVELAEVLRLAGGETQGGWRLPCQLAVVLFRF